MHDWHAAHGARLVNAGLWKRPHSYPRAGESEFDAANREARNVRTNVGIVDVSTLGKIELQGRDVAEFLNRVYINRWDTLAVGPLPLWRDAARRRHRDGRRHDLAPRAHALPDDDDHGERGPGDAAPRAAAAGRLARTRRLRHVGHRAVGGGRAGGPARAAGARDARRHRRVQRGVSVPRGRRVPRAHGHRPDPRAPLPDELLGRARLRDPRARRSRPRDVGGRARGRRGVRHHALRHRGNEHAAHRKGPRRRRSRRPTAAPPPTTSAWATLVSTAKWCIGKPLLARPALLAARSAGSWSGSPRTTARRCRAAPRSSPIPSARRRIRCWAT